MRKLIALVAGNSENPNKKGSTDEDENNPEKDPHDGHYSSSHFCLLANFKTRVASLPCFSWCKSKPDSKVKIARPTLGFRKQSRYSKMPNWRARALIYHKTRL